MVAACRRAAWAEWTCKDLSKGISILQHNIDTISAMVKDCPPRPKRGAVLKDAEQDPLFRAILKPRSVWGFFCTSAPADEATPLQSAGMLTLRQQARRC